MKKVDSLKVDIFFQVTDNNEYRIFYHETTLVAAGYNHYPVHLTFTNCTKIMLTVRFMNTLHRKIYSAFSKCVS